MQVLIFSTVVLMAGIYAIAGADTNVKNSGSPSEIQALLSETRPEVQERLVKELVARVGPEGAQEQLLHSGLPFTGETHFLIHTVGGEIYKEFGTEGILRCRPYFLGACYHGFLIEAIARHGEGVVGDIWPQCQEAGVPLMHQCAHAAGHGLMANRHSIPKALAECDSLSARINDFPSFNCYDGVFMENLWKVHHGHLSHELNISSDISYPCDDPNLQPKYQPACWGNQVSALYRVFEGDLAKVAGQCESLSDASNKDACFNGLARHIHSLANGNAGAAFQLCAASGHRETSCLITNAEASFALGDRVNFPFQICSHMKDTNGQAQCYDKLSSLIVIYGGSNPNEMERICAQIPERNYLGACAAHAGPLTARSSPGPSEVRAHFAPTQQGNSGPLDNLLPTPASQTGDQYPYPYPYVYPYPYPYPVVYEVPYQVPYQVPYPVPYTSPPPE